MADLAPAALQFLQKHLNFDQRGYLSKKKMRREMAKFWRRREKALAEFQILPPDHPRKTEFQDAIKSATEIAEKGDLKAGYKALDSIKLAARSEANVVKSGLDINAVLVDLAPLEAKAARLSTIATEGLEAINRKANFLEVTVTMMAKATDAKSHDEAVQLAGQALGARTEYRDRLTSLQSQSDQVRSDYTTEFDGAPDTKTTLARLEHNLDLLRAEGKLSGNIEGRFVALMKQVIDLGLDKRASEFTNRLNTRVATCKKAVEEGCARALELPPMESGTSTDNAGNRLDAAAEAERLGDTFKALEEQNEARIDAARKRMQAEANWDLYLERHPIEPTLVVPSRVTSFDTSDVLGVSDLGFDPLDRSVENDVFADAAAARLETLLSGAIDAYTQSDPDDKTKVPDEVLEVASRTLEGWCEEVAKALGLVWDPENLSPAFLGKIEAGAKAMQQKAMEIYPDKAAPDLSSFTMGGVVYDDVKKLGEGGGGEVFLAKSADGRTVVIKHPLSAEDLGPNDSKDPVIDEMRTEILAHRAITGGEDGPCSDNLLEHQGMVLSADGIPLPVMDLAEAGDASEFATAMSSLSGTGVISESARQALVAVQMRDVLKGVKAMHDQGYAHFDLKDLNVFMAKDGTFKVADFGLAQEADSREDTLDDLFETSELYKSPEISGSADLTMKGDLFSLGAMIQRAQSTLEDQHIDAEGFGYIRPGSTARKEMDGQDVDVSASTRLISKLMSENAEDRPSIETVLETSYFREIDEGHTPEQIERLREAAAAYAATVGRKTQKLEKAQLKARANIAYNQRVLSQEATGDLIRSAELALKRFPDEISRLQNALAKETDPDKIATLENKIDTTQRGIAKTKKNLAAYRDKLAQPLSEADIKKARDEIEKSEADLKKIGQQIAAIREDSQYDDVMEELQKANAPFR